MHQTRPITKLRQCQEFLHQQKLQKLPTKNPRTPEMELQWLEMSNAIHSVEEMAVRLPSSRSVFLAGVVGVPVAVLLHDTAHLWMPHRFQVPILSWFQRKWCNDPQQKKSHLRMFRNALIFAWIVCALQEGDPKFQPFDYVVERLGSATARKSVTQDILSSRRAAFGATHELVGEGVLDEANARQQRDAALRRRHTQELRRGANKQL